MKSQFTGFPYFGIQFFKRVLKMKKIFIGAMLAMMASTAIAGSWVKVRGRTVEEAFYNAQEKYGSKFVKRGSCGLKESDGYIYCDALIEG